MQTILSFIVAGVLAWLMTARIKTCEGLKAFCGAIVFLYVIAFAVAEFSNGIAGFFLGIFFYFPLFAGGLLAYFKVCDAEKCKDNDIPAEVAKSKFIIPLSLILFPLVWYSLSIVAEWGDAGFLFSVVMSCIVFSSLLFGNIDYLITKFNICFAFTEYVRESEIKNKIRSMGDNSDFGYALLESKIRNRKLRKVEIGDSNYIFKNDFYEGVVNRIENESKQNAALPILTMRAIVESEGIADSELADQMLLKESSNLVVIICADGPCFVHRSNIERIVVCSVCGKVGFGSGNNKKLKDHYCCQYCKDTAGIAALPKSDMDKFYIAKDFMSRMKEGSLNDETVMFDNADDSNATHGMVEDIVYHTAKRAGVKAIKDGVADVLGDGVGQWVGIGVKAKDSIADVLKCCDGKMSEFQCKKNVAKNVGGIAGGAMGVKTGMVVGAMLTGPLAPLGAFAGAAVGGYLGNKIGRGVIKEIADSFGEDDYDVVMGNLNVVFKFFALKYGLSQCEISEMATKVTNMIGDKQQFVEDVVPHLKIARQHIARCVAPIVVDVLADREDSVS